jgi:radical SAM superfamily enzyme YgiQ (UPF0313 family)
LEEKDMNWKKKYVRIPTRFFVKRKAICFQIIPGLIKNGLMRVLLLEPTTHPPGSRIKEKASMLRLALPYLAAVIPPNFDVKIAYDLCEEIEENYDLASFDLVGVSSTGHTGQMLRAIKLGKSLKELGVKSVIGGPVTVQNDHRFVSLLSRYFDSVLIGDAESTFISLIDDVRRGSLKKVYRGDNSAPLENIPPPRFDLVNFDLFTPPHVYPCITARGCPRKCDFCSEFLYSPWRFRPVDEIVTEQLRTLKSKYGARQIIFRDDDFLVHPRRSRELLKGILPLGLEWACQTDLNLARHSDIARLAVDAGLRSVCFGLESVLVPNLNSMGKKFFTLEETSGLLRMLNGCGVETQINIIFGQDYDTPDIFDKTVDFLLENKVSYFYANILFPQYGTTLYQKLRKEGRMLDAQVIEDEDFSYLNDGSATLPWVSLEMEDPAFINFVPKHFTAEQLVSGTIRARNRFYAERSASHGFGWTPGNLNTDVQNPVKKILLGQSLSLYAGILFQLPVI